MSFVEDDETLSAVKSAFEERPDVPTWKKIRPEDWNAHRSALLNIKSFLRGAPWLGLAPTAADPEPAGVDDYIWLKDDGTLWVTSGGVPTQVGAGADVEKPFGELSEWYDSESANMTAGVENDFVHPSMLTHTILVVRGADNNGTTLTGLDATGVNPGEVRVLLCTSTSEEDVGNISLTHEDERSLETNRFRCPGHYDYTQPIYGMTLLMRGPDERWHILSQNGYSKRVLAQSLQLYPHMQIGTDAAPISGTKHDWAPTGEATFGGMGIATSDLSHKTHSYWRCYVDADGATITGIEGGWSGPGGTIDASDMGAIKVIKNFGPGALTIKHLGAGSEAKNLIRCPGDHDLILQKGDTVWMIKAWYSGPGEPTNPQYSVIATSQGNEVFPSVTTTGRTTTQTLTVGPQVDADALPAGLTSNWDPGDNAVINVAGTAPYSTIDGMVPADALNGNEIRIIRNSGIVPIVLVPEISSASDNENKFILPWPGMTGSITSLAPPYCIPPGSEVALQYRPTASRWCLLGNGNVYSMVNTGSYIIPAVMAGAAVNNYDPSDAGTSLPGRFAYVWFIQGAVGTELTGIEASPAGSPPYRMGDRLLLINLGSGMTVKNFDGRSEIPNRFRISADIIISQYGAAEFIRGDGSWHCVTKS